MAKIPMTKAGFDKLLAEHEQLNKVDLPAIIARVAEARAEGDLKENAEYHAAREKQGYMQDKIQYLEQQISNAQVIENVGNKDTIAFGSTVVCAEVDDEDDTEEYMLVGGDEANPADGKISIDSPLGKALLGKKAGDIFEVEAPAGSYEMLVISFE